MTGRRAAAALPGLALLAGYWLTLHAWGERRNAALEQRLYQRMALVSDAEKVAQSRGAFDGEVEALASELRTLATRLPAAPELDGLRSDLTELASDEGLSVVAVGPGEEPGAREDFYAALPVSIVLEGELPRLARFVGRLPEGARLIALRSLEVSRTAHGYSAVLTADTYYAPRPEPPSNPPAPGPTPQ